MRANAGVYAPRERLLRLLRHEKVDRLPISPIGLSPYTWQTDFPVYHPVLKVAEKHCEFMCKFGISEGVNFCKPEALDITTEKKEEGERETRRTTITTPEGELTSVRIRDRSIGSWASAKALVNNEEELDKRESIPFEPLDVNLDGLEEFDAGIGDAGLPYCTGIRTPLLIATWGMSEEYRTIFCFTKQERLRKMVDRSHERVMAHITRLLDARCSARNRHHRIESSAIEKRTNMSYRKLTIWEEARSIVIDVHKMTLIKLPSFELYEEGSQIRRLIKSVKSNIVEGYGRRRYKQEYIRFLTFALASCDETADHLETLYETGSLKDKAMYKDLYQKLQTLGKKINRFIQSVEKEHRTGA